VTNIMSTYCALGDGNSRCPVMFTHCALGERGMVIADVQ